MSISLKERFGSKEFYKRAILIAVPVMAQLLIQNLVSLIDNFMVSGLGDVKMSGVNVSGQIFWLFLILLNTICISGGIFLTQFSGAKDNKGMRQSFCFKLILGLLAVLLYMIVCIGFPEIFLRLMVRGNVQENEIVIYGTQYMRIMGLMGIPMIISMIIASSFREIGDVKVPLIISVIATLVNTFFNWVFIYGNLGAPCLEVKGAALATVIARFVEMIIFLVYAIIKKPNFMISIKDLLHIDFALFRRIGRKGSMILFSEMVWAVAETVTKALYNGKGGADIVSGMAAAFVISNLFFMAFDGMSSATGVILGKTLGSGDLDLARKQKNWLLNGSIIFGFIMLFVGLSTTFLIPVVFGNLSDESRLITKEMIWIISGMMPVWVYVVTQFAVSRSGGDTKLGLFVDGITNVFIIVPGMFIMAFFTDFGPVAMYGIIKLSEFVKLVIAHYWLKKEVWVKNLAVSN